MSTSYLDLHLAIDNERRLKGKIYHKHANFTFPIVNFKLISSNISATSTYGVYISQPIRYSRVYVYHIDVVVRAQLLSQQNNQTRLRSSKFEPIAIKKNYVRVHELVDNGYAVPTFMINDNCTGIRYEQYKGSLIRNRKCLMFSSFC